MTKKSRKGRKFGVLGVGISLTVIIGIVLGFNLFKGDKTYFLSGNTSHGHFQIELECQTCHNQPFSSAEEMQKSCESCHEEELDKVNDSHPKSAFYDPRNAELLEQLDARYCVTCHREHKPEITRKYGVTLAEDFCFHCHKEIKIDRPSHQEFEFNTCATSGCHNFHDNSMLYEKFLQKHISEPENLERQLNPQRTGLNRWLKKNKKKLPLKIAEPNITQMSDRSGLVAQQKINQVTEMWATSVHAKVDANCSSCHSQNDAGSVAEVAIEAVEQHCASCHKKQHQTFIEGKHGMRLAVNLSPMSTELARQKVDRDNKDLLGCTSCHNPHDLNLQRAAIESCLGCHQDQHSFNYRQSKHFEAWRRELSGDAAVGSGVSCATCHLPRIKKGRNVTVVHNQNLNLRPNTKMLRKVCMNCHGMEFSVAALVDEQLIQSNFRGKPSIEHPTFELIKQRILEANQSETNQSETIKE